jgi:hypothetical protein
MNHQFRCQSLLVDRRRLSAAIIALFIFAFPVAAHACKYNVRDVGFVDHDRQRYRLVIPRDPKAPEFADALLAKLKPSFAQSNVIGQLVDKTDVAGDATLESPDGRSLSLDFPGTSPADAATHLERLIESSLQRDLLSQLIERHSVMLLIEGSDAKANESARRIADESIELIGRSMEKLPKRAGKPPVVVAIDREKAAAERVLLWSLGVDEEKSPPRIVILHGRLRRFGPIIESEKLHSADLTAQLNLIGQDCECELDRSWMRGPVAPHVWSDELAAAATASLDFDPGHPLVRVEVGQILTRGPRNPNAKTTERRVIDPILGYEEIELPGEPAAPGSPGPPPAPSALAATAESPNTAPAASATTTATTQTTTGISLSFILAALAAIVLAITAAILVNARREH